MIRSNCESILTPIFLSKIYPKNKGKRKEKKAHSASFGFRYSWLKVGLEQVNSFRHVASHDNRARVKKLLWKIVDESSSLRVKKFSVDKGRGSSGSTAQGLHRSV